MKRIFLVVLWILATAILCSAQATIYFPHIANGVLGSTVWKTTILLTNTGAAGASGTITFAIVAGQTKKYFSAGTGGYSPGFATASTTAGAVTGTAIFSEFDIASGRLIAEAGVPAALAYKQQAVFVDTI